MAEGAGVSAELVERARERFDVGVAEVTGEVPVDCIPVVPASVLQFFPSLVGEVEASSMRSTTRVKPLLL